jgi:hypothetical protein
VGATDPIVRALREGVNRIGKSGRAGVDLPVAVVDNVITATPVLYYVHADHLGRPIAMTNAAKAFGLTRDSTNYRPDRPLGRREGLRGQVCWPASGRRAHAAYIPPHRQLDGPETATAGADRTGRQANHELTTSLRRASRPA